MSIKRFILLLLPLSCFFACKPEIVYISEPLDFSITSPKQDWTYYEDTKIMLAINVNTNDIVWRSSLSGFLGEGNHCVVFLPEGFHVISAEIQNVRKEKYVYIRPNTAQERSVLINYSPLEVKLKEGKYYSFLYTHDGSVNDFRLNGALASPKNSRQFFTDGGMPEPLEGIKQGIRPPMPKAGKYTGNRNKPAYALGRTGIAVESNRTFFVINTLNQYGPPHRIDAELFYQSDKISVWVPVFNQIENGVMGEFIQTVETLVIPRVEAIWGKPADIDGDGRIAVLFSGTLNDENLATGFFNPTDFFEKNDDAKSEAYNPSSNEMDIIYVGMPVSDRDSPYSIQYVIATIAHELAHACTFTTKTWSRIKNGETSAKREELFIDEGWSHLTENICGFGISGGNIKFLKRFLDNTSMYSFCGANKNGLEDSAGMRGAITLFLSWLFWKSGGISWDSTNPIEFIDRGGIAFLKRMLELPDTGWDSIGKAYGRPVHLLFSEMLMEINNYRKTNSGYNYKIDPVTKEAVDFFVNMGDITISGSDDAVNVGFPKLYSIYSSNSLLPWSFTFLDELLFTSDSLVTLFFDKNNGSVFYSYSYVLSK
jgi:hypothetical protein